MPVVGHGAHASSVGRGLTSATEPSAQLVLESGWTSNSQTCHTAVADILILSLGPKRSVNPFKLRFIIYLITYLCIDS